MGVEVPLKQKSPQYFRRLKTRIETKEDVWVYWSWGGKDEFSRIRNIGSGGVFIETSKIGMVGAKTKLNFLAREGQIRAEASIRHLITGRGLGLKFTAIGGTDRQRLEALINRLSTSL
jgi:hypothetical protein